MPFGVWIFTSCISFPESSINAAPRAAAAAQEPVVYPMRSFLLPRIIYASSKPVLLMFFSLTDPAVFLPDHAICFIITHNEKMLNYFRIFSRLFFYLRNLFFSQLPVVSNSAALLSACFTIFSSIPIFPSSAIAFFPLAGPCSRRYGKEILCAVICSSK